MIKKKQILTLAAFFILIFAVSGLADKNYPKPRSAKFSPMKGPAADAMVKSIENSLEKIANTTTSVRGSGEVENEFIHKKNVKEFDFMMKKPGKLRLEFTAPDDVKGTLMMSDGTALWTYIPEMDKTTRIPLNQGLTKDNQKPLQSELGLLDALVSTPLERKAFWNKFEIVPLGEEKIAGRDCYVVEFRLKGAPKTTNGQGAFNQYLWIEKKTGITRMIELLVLGAPELVTIKSLELNPKIEDSSFVMKKK